MTELVRQQALNGVILACTYALFALGLSIVWGVLKVLNLAHAEVFTAGALATVALGRMTELPLAVVLVGASALSGVVALAVDTVAFWPLRRKKLDTEEFELASLITSLGASTILVSVAAHLAGNQTQPVPPALFPVAAWRFGGFVVTNVQVAVVVAALALTCIVWAVVNRTQAGRALRALAYAPDMARVVGVRTEIVYRVTVFACGALAGVAGVLLAILLGTVDAYSGAALMLKAIAIIVLAGSGAVLGLIVGGLVLGLGETVGSLFLPPVIESALPFLIILVVLLARPTGLFGRSEAIRT